MYWLSAFYFLFTMILCVLLILVQMNIEDRIIDRLSAFSFWSSANLQRDHSILKVKMNDNSMTFKNTNDEWVLHLTKSDTMPKTDYFLWKFVTWMKGKRKTLENELLTEKIRFGGLKQTEVDIYDISNVKTPSSFQTKPNVERQKFSADRVSVIGMDGYADDVRKGFEEGLDNDNLDSLPAIQIIQVIETTEALPTEASMLTVIEEKDLVSSSKVIVTKPNERVIVTKPNERVIVTKPNERVIVTKSNATLSPTLFRSSYIPSSTNSQSSSFSFQPSHWKKSDIRFTGVTTRRFIGLSEVPYSLFDEVQFYEGNHTDITLISVSTSSRLFYIPFLISRWTGYYCFILYTSINQMDHDIMIYRQMNVTDKVSIIFYGYTNNNKYTKDFPVNLLRNIGIRTVFTSHFLVLDMDMWVNHNMYVELQQIPSSVINNENNIIIIPTIFLPKYRILSSCKTLSSCIHVAMKTMPKTKDDIVKCFESKHCSIEKSKIKTHKYVTKQWFSIPSSKAVVRIACLDNFEQEPYFIVKLTPTTPIYDERFINYGFNKIQYFEHLRLRGVHMYILSKSFAVDMPHHDSNFRKEYVSRFVGSRVSSMETLFKGLQRKWQKDYNQTNKMSLCGATKRMYVI